MVIEVGIFGAIALMGYLLGAIPTGYIVVKNLAHKNIMDWGTGNVGTLNTLRATQSKALTLLTLSGDVLKGVLAMIAGMTLATVTAQDSFLAISIGGILAVVGHNYSIFLRFRGGKGIATSLPLLLYLSPELVALWIAVFLLAVLATRFLVLGQILGTIVVPIVAVVLFPGIAIPVVILAVVVFVRHAPRIRNLMNGTEPKLYYKVEGPPGS